MFGNCEGLGPNQGCTQSAQCASLQCAGGRCAAGNLANGTACPADGQCLSGDCNLGFCEGRGTYSPCSLNAQCASSSCVCYPILN
jgi:hypothetical protein